MTPQFTTPCYVRVDDAQQRKEVCEKLTKSGYVAINMAESIDSNYLFAFDGWISRLYGIGLRGEQGKKELDLAGFIDCGTNTDLFLALVGMREDTIVNQWHIAQTHIMFKKLKGEVVTASKKRYISIGEMFMPLKQNVHFTWLGGDSNDLFRKATAQEIIEHFNKKGETE